MLIQSTSHRSAFLLLACTTSFQTYLTPLTWIGADCAPADLYTTIPIHAIEGTRRYSYNPTALFDPQLFTGTFAYEDSAAEISWIATPDPAFLFNFTDPLTPITAPSSWYWRSAGHTWHFDAGTLRWSTPSGPISWQNLTFNQWINTETNESWLYAGSTWTHQWEGGSDVWIHTPLSDVWCTNGQYWNFNEQTLTWTQILEPSHTTEPQQWLFNPLRESVSCITSTAGKNSWRYIGHNTWLEEYTGRIWGADNRPPFFPPPVVTQFTAIYDLQKEISTTILPTTPPQGEYVWTDNQSLTIRIHTDCSIDVDLPLISAHVGRGARYGYAPSSFFESSLGEKWLLQTYTGDWHDIFSGGYQTPQFTNDTNPTLGDVIQLTPYPVFNHLGAWARLFESDTAAWFYEVASNTYQSFTLPATYTFDLATLTWTNTATAHTWAYTSNGSSFVWRNLTTNQDWDLTVGARAFNVVLQDVSFSNQEYGTFSPLYNAQYLYTDREGTSTTVAATDFPFIYQLIPSNLVGLASTLSFIGYHDTTSTSPLSSTPGILNRMREVQESITALQEPLNTIVNAYEGKALYTNLIPLLTNTLAAGYKNKWLMDEFDRVINAYMIMTIDVVCYDDTFTTWAATQMSFETPGKGGFDFSVQTATEEKLSQGFLIGFAQEIPTNGQADFVVQLTGTMSVDPSQEYPYTTTYTVKLLSADHSTVIATQTTPISVSEGPYNPCAYTCLYEDGRIRIGVTVPSITDLQAQGSLTTPRTIFDYQLPSDSQAHAIRYYSFANPPGFTGYDGNTFQFIHLDKRYAYDIYRTNTSAIDMIAQCQDYHRLAQYDDAFSTLKTTSIALASTPLYSGKMALLKTIQTTLTPTALIDNLATLKHFACSENSLPFFNYYCDTSAYLARATSEYRRIITLLNDLDTSLTALLNPVAAAFPFSQQEDLVATAQAAIQTILLEAEQNSFAAAIEPGSILHESKNAGLIPLVSFLTEENQILQNLACALAQATPVILDTFASAHTIPLTQNINGTQEQILSLLCDRIAAGLSTPFAALIALYLVFSTAPFDEIRGTLNAYLTKHNYTNYHTTVHASNPPQKAQSWFAILYPLSADFSLQMSLDGSTLSLPFLGTTRTPNPTGQLSYIATTADGRNNQTLATQQQTVAAGSALCLNNSMLTTETTQKITTAIREVLAAADDKTDAYSRLYVKDALVALGNGNYTAQSGKSLSLLGAAEIAPDGNVVITLNSDLTIAGPHFLAPTTNFGAAATDPSRCIPPAAIEEVHTVHEITFYSPIERIITITSGTDLDLTGFGKGHQRITFAGKVKLIFEPNTRLRLPYTAPEDENRLTIAFKDNASLIFQGIQNYDGAPLTDPAVVDSIRSKILGCGTLLFSGYAQTTIYDSACVSVEADYSSNITDLEIILTEKSQFLIGSASRNGGSFHVGNSFDGGSNTLDPDNYPNSTHHPRFGSTENPFDLHPTHVSFTLTLNGTDACLYTGVDGFFGLGAGSISKKPLLLQPLFNTGTITLNLLEGTVFHTALLAFGPQIPRACYKLSSKIPTKALIKGGGAALMLATHTPTPFTPALSPTITDSYSLLAPLPLVMTRQQANPLNPLFKSYGAGTIYQTNTTYQLTAPLTDFFKALTFQELSQNNNYVIASPSQGGNAITFIDGENNIVTMPVSKRMVQDQSNKKVTTQNLAEQGVLRSRTRNPFARKFIKLRR